jgi:hypothetical protein
MVEEALEGVLEDDYEEVVEFECPICGTRVSDESTACPGCGAIFVTPEQKEQEVLRGLDAAEDEEDELSLDIEAEEGYELDDGYGTDVAVTDELDDEEIDAELKAMEADLEREVADAPIEVDVSSVGAIVLDQGHEADPPAEDVAKRHLTRSIPVTAEDHDALVELSEPTFAEKLFARAGLGMFLAGGALSLLVLMWDPIHGQPVALGFMQLNFLVFCLALFIVGFAVEMLQAYSLSKHDEVLATA